MEITVKIKCPCETDACACCACVSMHCDECHDHSEFQQGSYCSHCGRPLKAELQRNYVPKSEVKKLEAEVERLTTILNSYALQYGTVSDKQKVIDRAKAEVAREFIEIINDRIDNIRARIPYGGRAQGKTLAVEKMRLLESLKVEIAKKYTEGEG